MKVLAAGLLLIVAACSKPPERKAGTPVGTRQIAAESRKLQFQPGAWETTTVITTMNLTGIPASATKAATGTPTITRNCITPQQAARPDANILSGTKDGNCTYERFSMAGARIDAAMTCAPPGLPGTMAMTLAGGYSPTAFDMGMTMKSDLPGNVAMTMQATVKGKRTGACTPSTETAS